MDIRQKLFQYRSYTPIPFLILMVYFAQPTQQSFLIGFLFVVLGEFLRLWAVALAGSETRTTGPVGGTYLVTTGPFAYVRNPLYLGNMLIYAGVGVISNALFPWLTIAALVYFFLQYSFIAKLEEEHLAAAYGEEFHRYCSSVRRFLPRLTPYAGGMSAQPGLDWGEGLQSERRTLQAIGIIVIVLGVRWWMWS